VRLLLPVAVEGAEGTASASRVHFEFSRVHAPSARRARLPE
jgi:hypothetical protein